MSPLGFIQTLIHRLEIGAGSRYLRYTLLAAAVLILALLYDFRAYKNMSAPEAMDAAQLARNISQGKGYTTLFIRPFSLYLVQKYNQSKSLSITNANYDFARIRTAHPDLANPPVYPVVLAGLMKALPFNFEVNSKNSFWGSGQNFARYQPDFLIAVFNEILLLVVVVQTFFLARGLFDVKVARLSAALVLGSELLWHFSASGLPTILLLIIFLGLFHSLLKIELAAREELPRAGKMLVWAMIAGALVGLGALTRYAFGWLIIPVVVFLILFSGKNRGVHALVSFVAFAVLLTPWIIRNEMVSGTMFGTAGYAAFEGTFVSPKFQLERSVHPDMSYLLWLTPYFHKLLANAREILATGLFKTGGWIGVLFFAGLFLSFRSLNARRLRYFLLMCLGVLIVAQALGRTQLSEISPEINSENLLVLLVPLITIFGASFFYTLLDQMSLPVYQLRYVVITLFTALCCSPMIFALWQKTLPVAYPPYYPPEIQQTAGWMDADELMMSDVPWAVAWYGQHQCLWLTLDAKDSFFAVNDYLKPIQAIYLTPETMNGRFLTDWLQSNDKSWGNFIIEAVLKNQIPSGFPLKHAPAGFLPDRLFLTDRVRWGPSSE